MPHRLHRSGGSILRRAIPGFPDQDAMGCYPLFSCRDWSALHEDMTDLGDEVVTLSLVADPLGDHTPADLKRCFPDRVVPFKEHFVVDLCAPAHDATSAHHRRNARRALEAVDVVLCPDPSSRLDDWAGLYANLVRRHGITGIAAFSRQVFAGQLRVPGLIAFRAESDGTTVGMTLWYVQGDAAHYHLGAYSDRGYELGASFAMFSRAIEHFATAGLSRLGLGAGAGLRDDPADGLARFKRGWATDRRTAYFCGAVLAPDRHTAIVAATGRRDTGYFPAYREGEFGA